MLLSPIKKFLKKKFIRTKIEPIIIKDVQQNLLKGRVALISGGSSGIGLEIAKKFIDSQCNVIILGSNIEKLKNIALQIGSEYIQVDLNNLKELEIKINELYKTRHIDILVNSAGVHNNEKFGEVTELSWDQVLNTNVRGLYFLSQSVSKNMIAKKIKGNILNISSASAIKPSWTPYEISKRAVNGITLGLASILIKHGIIVNGLAPGPTATPMLNFNNQDSIDLTWEGNPSNRVSTPCEIANLALFMVSDLGKGIVGDTIYMTGGSGTICIDK